MDGTCDQLFLAQFGYQSSIVKVGTNNNAKPHFPELITYKFIIIHI